MAASKEQTAAFEAQRKEQVRDWNDQNEAAKVKKLTKEMQKKDKSQPSKPKGDKIDREIAQCEDRSAEHEIDPYTRARLNAAQ